MDRVATRLPWSDEEFKLGIGTTKPVFRTMLEILQADFDKLHESGGAPPDLGVGDKLLITLKYFREYVPSRHRRNQECNPSMRSKLR